MTASSEARGRTHHFLLPPRDEFLKSPFVFHELPELQSNLAAAAKLVHNCGYHRRDEELTEARKAMLG